MVTITVGHPAELEQQLRDNRLSICKKCLLFTNHPQLGYICDNNKHITLDGKLINYESSNSRSGCGCKLEIKTRLKNEKCILGKW